MILLPLLPTSRPAPVTGMLCRCLAFSFLISLTVAQQVAVAADPPGYRPLFDPVAVAAPGELVPRPFEKWL